MADKDPVKTTLDFSRVVYTVKGEAAKDMIDVDEGTDPSKCPSLTVGSILMNGLTLGAAGLSPADCLKMLSVAEMVQKAMQTKEGKLELTEGEISQIEQVWQKVRAPQFTTPLYSGNVQKLLQEGKLDIARKNQAK